MMSLPFHPLINAWFTETYGNPTPVQEEAWPLIAGGEHILALAPTGSGKTLTGFLAAISRFADGTYDASKLSVLYVSPLKALNEDIRRNLLFPLESIRKRFDETGTPFPAIRVETRSGDTPQNERRRFLSRPPSILALTPESLGIILLNPRGRQVLSEVRYVILDEIHAALGTKRGCYLSCQIDRLAIAAGEFQRVALSATVRPPEAAADFTGGLREVSGVYRKRKVRIVAPAGKKEIEFKVLFPGGDEEVLPDENGLSGVERFGRRYAELIRFVIERIKSGRAGKSGTILVFTDSRRRAERISYLMNRAAEEDPVLAGRPLSYCHHGSLSKDVRRSVEQALITGEISCVVATGSLELGIDIGHVDEVILAGSPGSSAVTLQRVGRSGHGVGMTSRGWLVPFHGMDLLQAAALSGAVEEKEIEETGSIESPLDILAQIILALVAECDRNEDELYETIRGFYVYRNLSRGSYDRIVGMLAGAYEGTRLRELKRHIFRDGETKTLSAAPGALLLLYTSGGVIASRGYYSLRLAPWLEGGAHTRIGELDEEFVWERRLGDCFDFGNRSWRITAITSEAVEVIPLPAGADSVPFWHGEPVYRSPVLSRRILELLDHYNREDEIPEGPKGLLKDFSPEAGEALNNFLAEQKSLQGNVPLPGAAFIPVEIVDDPESRGDACIVILHSFRGGGVNVPLSLALARDLEAELSMRIESSADDNSIYLRLPRSAAGEPDRCIRESLRRLSDAGKGEERFRERLEASGVFGAAFREAAERSLLLPRSPFGKRMPLWVIRQRSKQLFDAASPYRDFPVTAEAWRCCLVETFDMEGFNILLGELASGEIGLDFFRTRQYSPFSREQAWLETNALMYQYDERPDLMGPPSRNGASSGTGGPSLSDQVIAEALGNKSVRPSLKADLVADFCSRLRRELPGWAPEDSLTLSEWVKERIAIPVSGGGNGDEEWERLLRSIPPELSQALKEDNTLGGKLVYIKREGALIGAVVHRERAKKWKDSPAAALAADWLGSWLRYEGPLPLARISGIFGLSPDEAEEALRSLSEEGEAVTDVAVEAGPSGGADPLVFTGTALVSDRENLELLLRLGRRKQRPELRERPARLLVPFLARRQGIFMKGPDSETGLAPDGGVRPWRGLAGIAAPAKLWETEFFPGRCPSYSGELLDREIREGSLLWYGAGREKAAFSEPGDLELVLPALRPASEEGFFSGKLPAGFFDTPRSFWEIKDALDAGGAGIGSVADALWEEVWKGNLSADSWEPLRKALEQGFTSVESAVNARLAESGAFPERESSRAGRRSLRVPRALRERWRSGPPVRGNWFSLLGDSLPGAGPDILEEEEINRDRVRLLLERWGVLCRPLLEREAPAFSWSRLLPAMRRMELAGELVAGRFFTGVNSLQFASPRIAAELEEAEAERGIYWMNAADPASPAGLSVQGILAAPGAEELSVRRVPSSRLCFRGPELIAVSNRGGGSLEVFISPDDPDIAQALAFLAIPRTRKVQPEIKITVEKINGVSAGRSDYSGLLASMGFVKDRGKMILY